MAFKSVFEPTTTSPKMLRFTNRGRNAFFRDQFTLSTWLLIGASFHGFVSLLLPKSSIYLSGALFLILAYNIGTTILQVYGYIPNPEMADIIPGKVSAQVPDLNGNKPTAPSQNDIVVMFLGFKSNHPMKMLAPGFKEIGDYFNDMLRDLDTPEGREKYGFLGLSSYLGNHCETSNEILSVIYWRNIEGVHAFADSQVHRVAWDYWNQTVKQHPYLTISHEIYRAEAGNHENIYVNARPTNIGGTAFPIKSEDENQEKQWTSPLLDANRGVLASSNGRLGRKQH